MRAANQLEEGQGQYRVTFTAQAKSKVLAQFDRNEDSPHVVSARCKDVNDQDGVCVCVCLRGLWRLKNKTNTG